MKPEESAWQQLVAAARQGKDERDTAAPYGFATRVVALALAGDVRASRSLIDLFSWRALGVAGLLAVASMVANYSFFNNGAEDDVLSDETAVAALFEASGT